MIPTLRALAAPISLAILLALWAVFFWFGRRALCMSAIPAILCAAWSVFFALLALGIYALHGGR